MWTWLLNYKKKLLLPTIWLSLEFKEIKWNSIKEKGGEEMETCKAPSLKLYLVSVKCECDCGFPERNWSWKVIITKLGPDFIWGIGWSWSWSRAFSSFLHWSKERPFLRVWEVEVQWVIVIIVSKSVHGTDQYRQGVQINWFGRTGLKPRQNRFSLKLDWKEKLYCCTKVVLINQIHFTKPVSVSTDWDN